MIRSMTAFASRTGAAGTASWAWELRSVNGRGLDLRLRLPEGMAELEAGLRERLGRIVSRGSLTLSLRLDSGVASQRMAIDEAALGDVLTALGTVAERAATAGVAIAAPSAAEILGLRGVALWSASEDRDTSSLVAALLEDAASLLAAFAQMKASEGRALARIIGDQLDRIAALAGEAAVAAEARGEAARAQLGEALRRVLAETADVDGARLAQELALIAVKSDVTEEIDRLRAHVAAARELIDDPEPAGRRLDFLAQEFNREANTLCAKAASTPLTRIGLDLKATIDQMREQIQNVE